MTYSDYITWNLLLPFTSNRLEFCSSEFCNPFETFTYKVLSYPTYFGDPNP